MYVYACVCMCVRVYDVCMYDVCMYVHACVYVCVCMYMVKLVALALGIQPLQPKLGLGGIRKIKTVRYCFKIPRYN